jgi:hypothetical protein
VPRRNHARLPPSLPAFLPLAFTAILLMFSGSGCTSKSYSTNPRLKQIDELLKTQVPKGALMARVEYFLNARGYRMVDSPDKNEVVAIIQHIDTQTLQPVTARVTFHFDANNRLLSYELEAVPDSPQQP